MALTDNLVAYWQLEEASGNRADSVGSNTLTDNNTVTQSTGKISNAAQFTAANSEYLSITDNAALSTGDIDFSVAAWVYLDSTGTTRVILAKGTDVAATSGFEYGLYYTGGASRFVFRVRGGSTNAAVTDTTALSVSTWYYVVGWHDSVSNQIGIAVNAGTAVTASHSAGVADDVGSFLIGYDGNGGTGRYWNGRIDEVGVWKRVLTSTERTNLYNSGNGLAFSSFGGGTDATFTAAVATATATSPTSTLTAGATFSAQAAAATATAPTAVVSGGAVLSAAAASATATSPDAAVSAGASLAATVTTTTAASSAAAFSGSATFAGDVATAAAASPVSTLTAGAAGTFTAALATATAASPTATLYGTALFLAAVATGQARSPVAVLRVVDVSGVPVGFGAVATVTFVLQPQAIVTLRPMPGAALTLFSAPVATVTF